MVVVTDDVPMGVTPEQASQHIQLIGLVNDVSLRNLIPGELAKGFGFLQSKPRSALSPVLVTPDELGDAWKDDKLHLPMRTWINGQWFGEAECRRGHAVQFRATRRACGQDAPAGSRHHRRLGHDRQPGHLAGARPAWPSSAPWRNCATASR